EELALRPLGGARFHEALICDQSQLAEALRAVMALLFGIHVQAALIPPLGRREIADGGEVLEGMPQVEGNRGLAGLVTGALGHLGSFGIGVDALGLPTLALDLAQHMKRRRQRSNAIPRIRWLRLGR